MVFLWRGILEQARRLPNWGEEGRHSQRRDRREEEESWKDIFFVVASRGTWWRTSCCVSEALQIRQNWASEAGCTWKMLSLTTVVTILLITLCVERKMKCGMISRLEKTTICCTMKSGSESGWHSTRERTLVHHDLVLQGKLKSRDYIALYPCCHG